MELDIKENVIKDMEEKEAQAATKEALAAKNTSMEIGSDMGKGKGPMEEIIQKYLEQ